MVRSSTLTEEPLVNNIVHAGTAGGEGLTNFVMGLNPAGMVLIKSIDPTAVFRERYYHMGWAKSATHWAKVAGAQLHDVEGFAKLYEWCVDETASSTTRIMILSGFPYAVYVKESSPLVGWFYVLGVNND